MIKETFFNLSDDKRCRLIQAATEVFLENGFNGTSISKIVEKAQIPRGSFYQYFDSKEDTYLYLTVKCYEEYLDKFITSLKKTHGDVFASSTEVFSELLTQIIDKSGKSLEYLLFSERMYTPKSVKKLIGPTLTNQIKNRHEVIHNTLDYGALELDNRCEMDKLIRMLSFLFFSEVASSNQRDEQQNILQKKEDILHSYQTSLKWVKYGVLRKESDKQ